jgi:hypothetical protein
MYRFMQYTIRKIPKALDAALRRRAKPDRKTLNQVVVEAMSERLGSILENTRRRLFGDLLGARAKDPELQKALKAQRRIDPKLWR